MQAEADRWQNLIDDLLTRERHLNSSFKGDVTEPDPTRFVKLFLFIRTDWLEKQLFTRVKVLWPVLTLKIFCI